MARLRETRVTLEVECGVFEENKTASGLHSYSSSCRFLSHVERLARSLPRGCRACHPRGCSVPQPPQHANAVRWAKYTLSLLCTVGKGRWEKTGVSGLLSPFQNT